MGVQQPALLSWLVALVVAALSDVPTLIAPPADARASSSSNSGRAGSGGVNSTQRDGVDYLKIAWVGNSYTFFFDLPELVASLGASAQPPVLIDFDSVTVGGSSLTRLAEDARVHEMLRRDWDFVVLQDQSQIPGGARPLERDATLITLRDFYRPALQLIKAEAILYSTWGRRNGDPNFPEQYPDFLTMTARTTEGYELYRSVMDNPPLLPASTSPAGAAFEAVYANDRVAFEALYDPDGSHPSIRGSYLVSCVFYGVLTRRSSAGLQFSPDGITEEERAYFQAVADRVVFGSRKTDAL